MTEQEHIAELEAENAQQREQIATLLVQNAELLNRLLDLEARLAKDSHNSSKPPSSDGLMRQLPRTRSLLRKTGKKPGGQSGHPGETLHLVAGPDAVTEHQALSVRCPGCQPVTVGACPAAAPSRAQYGPRLRALAVYLVAQQFVPYARARTCSPT
jgi:transposase